MKKILVLPALMLATLLQAQVSQQARDSINKLTKEDHQLMLKQLGITTLRQGVKGSAASVANAVNYDETKANPFPNLPDPLIFNNGGKVTNAAQWPARRKEIEENFDREVYGRMPANTPKVKWEIVRSTDTSLDGVAAVRQNLIGHVDNSAYPSIKVDMQLELVLPASVQKKVPVIMELSWGSFRRPGDTSKITTPSWQADCLKRGWGFALLTPTSIQADNGAGLTKGIIGLMNKGARRKPDDWGALRAWAWGASRALDYFETLTTIDAQKVAIAGHSRYGKAALVALANDQRFATGFISSSGEGGAKLNRHTMGEIVENLTASGEYHWMAGNFIKYGGPLNSGDLPVDAHELIAMCAPRPVFISNGAKGDEWADPKGMFMAAVAAGPVYKLLGKKDLGTDMYPAVEQGLMDGEVSFRQHIGGHTPGPNWPFFLDYAARYFNKQ